MAKAVQDKNLQETTSQATRHEGETTRFVKKNWAQLGMTPVFIKLLVLEKGWTPDAVDDCFRELVGEDYAVIKMTEWIARLQDKGFAFPGGKPVFEILNEILRRTRTKHTGFGPSGKHMS